MNTKGIVMKRNKVVSVILVLIMISFLLGTFKPQQVHASGLSSGTGEVILGKYIETEFTAKKTIDLSNSDVNITFTADDKAKVDAEADESTLKWFYKMIALEGVDDGITNSDDEVKKYKLYEKYWYDDLDISSFKLDDETKARVDKIKSYGTLSKLLKLSNSEFAEVLGDWIELGYDYDDINEPEKKLDNLNEEIKNLEEQIKVLESVVENAQDDHKETLNKQLTDFQEELKEKRAEAKKLENEIRDCKVANTKKILGYKKVEIYNDKWSDFLVSKIAKNIPVEVKFAVKAIGDDEKDAYGVDGKKIKQGSLKTKNESVNLSTVDFGNKDQLYDEVFKDGVQTFLTRESTDGDTIGADGKDGITHAMLIDGATIKSSDDSQRAGGVKRGDPTYPGKRYLLEVGDSLSAYEWARYGLPGSGYVATFNLHLNPAVTYYVSDIKEDLITDVTFDKNGRLLTISKGIAKESDWNKLINSGAIDTNVADGTYRYKIVESSISPSTIGNDRFYKNTETKILDVTISGGEVTDVDVFDDVNMYKVKQGKIDELQQELDKLNEQMAPLQEKISEITSRLSDLSRAYNRGEMTYREYDAKADELKVEMQPYLEKLRPLRTEYDNIYVVLKDVKGSREYNIAEFTNPLDKEVKVEKTIEGGDDLVIETLDQPFTYRISTNLPKGASTFVIEDNLEKVLEFADPAKTTIKIAGKALSDEDKALILTQSASQLKVELDKTFLKENGGKNIAIEFAAKLKDGADLSEYEDNKVPNVAEVLIDGEYKILSTTEPTVTPPKDYKPSKKATTKDNNKKATTKTGSAPRTGDEIMLGIIIALLLAAATAYALKKRKSKA